MHEEGYIYVSNFSDSLSICVTPEPSFRGSQKHPSSRWLGLTFDAYDKEALFFQALNVFNPAASVGGKIPVEDYHRGKWDDLMNQFERSFEQATAKLPMLHRLKEEYENAIFLPNEVRSLREECMKVRATTEDVQALSALKKLILACDEAIKEQSGLFFASD